MRETLLALTIVSATAIVPDANAQTGQAPKGQSTWSIPPASGAASDKAADKTSTKTRKPCPRYGDGFYYVPGSNTCIKITGDVRTDVTIGGR